MRIRSTGFVMLPLLGSALMAGTPAVAADGNDAPRRDRLVTIGLGAHVFPKYPGSDSVQLAPVPDIDIGHVGDPLGFEAPDQGISIGLLGRNSRFDIGPVVQLQGKRKEKDVGAAVGNVGFTVEPGIFAQVWVAPWLRMRGEVLKGINGHDSWLGDAGADIVIRDAHTIFSVGPRVRIGEARFQRTYFGVTPAVAVRTGLPVYTPGGGVYEAGGEASFTHQFNPVWGISAFAGYNRLVRDAGNSPIVRRFGSRDQFSGGIGLTYSFVIHRH